MPKSENCFKHKLPEVTRAGRTILLVRSHLDLGWVPILNHTQYLGLLTAGITRHVARGLVTSLQTRLEGREVSPKHIIGFVVLGPHTPMTTEYHTTEDHATYSVYYCVGSKRQVNKTFTSHLEELASFYVAGCHRGLGHTSEPVQG